MPIPPSYDDGCTHFPQRFGRVSHRHICRAHDIAYFWGRDPLSKIWADIAWSAGVLWAHRFNVLWWPVVIPAVIVADAALWTAGWRWWLRRHQHGPRDWRNA